jgi:hypothetical protein
MADALRTVAANDEQIPAYEWTHVLLSAVVRNAFGEHPVKIREVSPKGAVIQGAASPPTGSRVLLIRGAIAVMGTVVWAKAGRYCLEFQDIIGHEQLLIAIPTADKLAQPLKPLFPLPDEIPGIVAKH